MYFYSPLSLYKHHYHAHLCMRPKFIIKIIFIFLLYKHKKPNFTRKILKTLIPNLPFNKYSNKQNKTHPKITKTQK